MDSLANKEHDPAWKQKVIKQNFSLLVVVILIMVNIGCTGFSTKPKENKSNSDTDNHVEFIQQWQSNIASPASFYNSKIDYDSMRVTTYFLGLKKYGSFSFRDGSIVKMNTTKDYKLNYNHNGVDATVCNSRDYMLEFNHYGSVRMFDRSDYSMRWETADVMENLLFPEEAVYVREIHENKSYLKKILNPRLRIDCRIDYDMDGTDDVVLARKKSYLLVTDGTGTYISDGADRYGVPASTGTIPAAPIYIYVLSGKDGSGLQEIQMGMFDQLLWAGIVDSDTKKYYYAITTTGNQTVKVRYELFRANEVDIVEKYSGKCKLYHQQNENLYLACGQKNQPVTFIKEAKVSATHDWSIQLPQGCLNLESDDAVANTLPVVNGKHLLLACKNTFLVVEQKKGSIGMQTMMKSPDDCIAKEIVDIEGRQLDNRVLLACGSDYELWQLSPVELKWAVINEFHFTTMSDFPILLVGGIGASQDLYVFRNKDEAPFDVTRMSLTDGQYRTIAPPIAEDPLLFVPAHADVCPLIIARGKNDTLEGWTLEECR